MLLQESDTPFNDSDSIAELKLDGIRLQYSHMETKIFFTRHHNDVSSLFPELMALPVTQGTIRDGKFFVYSIFLDIKISI
jgi:DNA ligase 1